MPQHNASSPSVFIVRAIPRDERVDYYASHANEGFAAFNPAYGPLHASRFRNVISQFNSKEEADEYVKGQSARTLQRFQDILVEPAPPELVASFQTMDAERRATLQKLLPLVDEVLKVFDFARVHKAMVALDWKYTNNEQCPSIDVLEATARRLLISAAEEDSDNFEHASGGFRSWRSQDQLYLTFAIETAYAEPGRVSRL